MFLKVRDNVEKKWWFITEFDRFVVSDPVKAGEDAMSEGNGKTLHAEGDFDLVLLDESKDFSYNEYQVINCIKDGSPGTAQKEYRVLFNSWAFLCNEKGDTVERFFLNRP